MNANFTRPMSQEVMDDILLSKHFRFLTRNITSLISNDPNALTVQLLSRDRLAYHHGSKCVLTLHLHMKDRKPMIKCAADRDFRDHRLNPECSRHYRRLMRNWVGTETSQFQESFKNYLKAVIGAVEPRYYAGDDQGNRAEGYWTNMAYQRFGAEWSKKKPWLVIDRDFSLGFPQASEKKAFYADHAKPYVDLKQQLQQDDRERWGKPSKRAAKQEAGLLAVDKDGKLIIIELRRGSNTSGICWAPMAAAAHRDTLTDALPSVASSIATLIMQRVELGVIPSGAAKRIPADGFKDVSAAVAIAHCQPDDHRCWDLLKESITKTEALRPGTTIETAKIFNQ